MINEPPELWAFLVANSLLFVAGVTLSGLSYRAYRNVGHPGLLYAAAGFCLITIGGFTSLLYQVGFRRDYHLGGRELLALQTIETLTITAGFVVIFWALTRY